MTNIPKEMSFWSMVIKPEDKYTFTVERSFHISKAVIDFTSPDTTYRVLTSLMVDCDDQKGIILCNLEGNDFDHKLSKHEANLDVHFRVGQRVTLYSENPLPESSSRGFHKPIVPRIHLSGYQFV